MFIFKGGFLLAWTPYTVAVLIRICMDKNTFPPIFGTLPAVFAKSGVVYVILISFLRKLIFILFFRWNPIIYVIRNGNFRFYLPFYSNHRPEQRSKF
jgi:hypothetical protein